MQRAAVAQIEVVAAAVGHVERTGDVEPSLQVLVGGRIAYRAGGTGGQHGAAGAAQGAAVPFECATQRQIGVASQRAARHDEAAAHRRVRIDRKPAAGHQKRAGAGDVAAIQTERAGRQLQRGIGGDLQRAAADAEIARFHQYAATVQRRQADAGSGGAGTEAVQAQQSAAALQVAAEVQVLQIGVAAALALGQRAERGDATAAPRRTGTPQHRAVVQQHGTAFGNHQFAVDVAGAAERDRGVEHGAAAAAHVSARPGEVVAQREIAAAAEIQVEQVVAGAADGRVSSQREVATVERQRAVAGQVEMRRELVACVAVRIQPQRAFGRHIDARAVVGAEVGHTRAARTEIQVAVLAGRAQGARGRDMKRAAVLDVERVVVTQVQRAGDGQSPLQEFVAGHLGQRCRSAEGGGTGAGHAAGGPDHIAADVEIAAAAQVGSAQGEVARAGDRRIACQREMSAAQRQCAVAGQFQKAGQPVARIAIGKQPQRAVGRHVDAGTVGCREAGDAGGARVEVDVTIVSAGTHGAGGCDMQRAAVLDVEPVVVVQVERAGDVEPALQELVAGGLGQRCAAAEGGGAGAGHAASGPHHAAADVQVAVSGQVGTAERERAVAGDGRIAGQREAAAGQCKRAVAGQCETGREAVARIAVGKHPQAAVGGHFDAGARVRAEGGRAGCPRVEVNMAVVTGRAQQTGRGDMQRAAVLDVEPVIVAQVERAGDVEPALQELVAGDLGQRGMAAERGGAGAGHAAGGPHHAAADIQVAVSGQVGAAERERAVAGDDRIAGQREAAAGQRERTFSTQFGIDRKPVARVAVRIEVDPAPVGDFDARPGIRTEEGRAAAGRVGVDVSVVRRRGQRTGRGQMQCAAVAQMELVVVLEVERAGDVEPSVEVAIVVIRWQFAAAGQRDRAAAGDRAAVPDQTAEGERRTAVQRAAQIEGAGQGGRGAVQIQRAAGYGVVAVECDARRALQALISGVGIGGCLQRADGGDRVAELDGRTGAAHRAQQDAAFARGEHRHDDVRPLVAGRGAVAVAGLQRHVAGALHDDAQIGAMRAAGHQIDAGTRPAFLAAQVARLDQQAAALGQRELPAGFSLRIAAAGVAEACVAHRDRTLRAQHDVGGLALFLDLAFVDDGRAERGRIDAAGRAAIESAAAVGRSVASAALQHDGQRVEQQGAVAAACSRSVGPSAVEQGDLAGHFDLAAIAAAPATARPDVAVEGGRLIGPHHDLAAIAFEQCVGQQAGAAGDPGRLCVAHLGIGPLPVATDQHRTAAGIAGCIEFRRGSEGDDVGGHFDLAATTDVGRGCRGSRRCGRRAGSGRRQFDVGRRGRRWCGRRGCGGGQRFWRRERAGCPQRAVHDGALLRGDLDPAAGTAAGVDPGASLDLHFGCRDLYRATRAVDAARNGFRPCDKRDRLRAAQHDAAVGRALGAGRLNPARLCDRRAEHARAAVARDQLPEVDRFAAGFDAHAQRRLVRVCDVHALAGGKQHVAVLGGDDAGVLDIGRNQQQRAAGRPQRAFVAQLRGRAFVFETQTVPVEILVPDIQRRRHQTGGIDLGPGTEQDAVRVDQEYAAVGDQVAENLRRILTDHPVQYGGGRSGLDETGGFPRLDRELLPVDDGLVARRDVQRAALLLDADLSLDDLMAGRVGDRETGQCSGHGGDQATQRPPALALAARCGFFRDRHIATLFVGKNQSVTTLVHVGLKFDSAGPM